MSTLSWSKIWTVCHNILGPICDVLPAVWWHVDILSQDFSPTHLRCPAGFSAKCGRFVALFLDICDVPPTCSANCGRFVTGSTKKSRNLMRQSLEGSVVTRESEQKLANFREKWTFFVTFGQNVTAKLDKKYADKMSQSLGQNITVRRFVTLWQTVQIY